MLCNFANINHYFVHHSLIVTSFRLIGFVVLYSFTYVMMMMIIMVVLLVIDIFFTKAICYSIR